MSVNVLRPKDPDEVVDYTLNWAPDLGADTISSVTTDVTGAVLDSESNTTTTTTFWLSGGDAGEFAIITTTVLTAGGRTFEDVSQVAIVSNHGATPVTGYVRPTPADFITMYPAFASVPASTISMWLAQAPVDESWIETDFANAIMAWTAHTMTANGFGTNEIAGFAMSGVSRLKSGTLDVSFAEGAAGVNGYATTAYGRLWLELLRRNKGGPRIAVGGVGLASGYAKDWVWPMGGGYQ